MTALVIASIVIFLTYTTYAIKKFGVPDSLSETFYLLENRGWIFQAVLFSCAALLLVPLMEATNNDFKLLEFLTVGGVFFVSVAPFFKLELEGRVHGVSAIVSGISGITWSILQGFGYIPLFSGLLFIGLYFLTKTGLTFWAEMIIFASVYTTLILMV